MSTEELHETAVDPKLEAAETMLATLRAENEKLAGEKNAALDLHRAQLVAKLDAAPASVKARFAGKELDPIEGVKQVDAEIANYQAMEAEAKAAARAETDAYRAKLAEKYGIKIPAPDAVKVDATPGAPQSAGVQVTHNSAAADLATVSHLNKDQLTQVTGGLSAMANWLAARKSAAMATK